MMGFKNFKNEGMKVGKWYRRRDGAIVPCEEVVSDPMDQEESYFKAGGISYTSNGEMYGPKQNPDWELVQQVKQPHYIPDPAPPPLGLHVDLDPESSANQGCVRFKSDLKELNIKYIKLLNLLVKSERIMLSSERNPQVNQLLAKIDVFLRNHL